MDITTTTKVISIINFTVQITQDALQTKTEHNWGSPMTKASIPSQNKAKKQYKDAIKHLDYTKLRTYLRRSVLSLSNYSIPTDVINPG